VPNLHTEAVEGPEELRLEVLTMSCPNCTKHRIIAIGVTIGDDRVTMHSCCHCGTRWWEQEGRPVPLPNVLELAASNR
jgi:hypothetical protein